MAIVRAGRRWLAPRLRTLLLGILALAVCLGLWVRSARDQEAAIAAVSTSPYSSNVTYDDDPTYWPERTPLTRRIGRALKSRVPDRIKAALGRDYFDTVLSVAFSGGESGGELRDREVFRRLGMVPSLDQVGAEIEAVDADVVHLARLRQLRWLEFRTISPRLTDA